PSFKDINTLWAGTDDGLIWLTRDGGKNWDTITPKELTPWSKITQISASHFDNDSAYASVSRFRINDERPYIYRTHDGGRNWKLITAGLPEFGSVNTIREDPVRKGLLFAGTESSVWLSFDDGDHWQSLQLNLPHTSMRDLWIHDDDLIVATHGRAFWILDDIAPLREVAESLAGSDHLFAPAPAFRIQRDTNTDTPLPPDEPAGANPPDGAIIDYYLAQASSAPVTLEILDARGHVERKFSSADKPEVTEDELKKQLIPLYWLRPFRALSSDAGMHRWIWDLHYSAPDAIRHDYPIAAIPGDTPRYPLGPNALPGSYTARLTVNGKSYTAPLIVKMDPRVKTSTASLKKKFDLEMHLASLLGQTSSAVSQAGSIREPLQKLTEQAGGQALDSLKAFQNKLVEVAGAQPGVAPPAPDAVTLARTNSQVAVLYGEVCQADAEPTASQYEAVTSVEGDISDGMKRWNELKNSDLPVLNRELRKANLPEVQIEAGPHKEEALSDEE
ncbi:MAG: hypothetical protein WB992_12845, partial [Bryobacteraceae bacterium]